MDCSGWFVKTFLEGERAGAAVSPLSKALHLQSGLESMHRCGEASGKAGRGLVLHGYTRPRVCLIRALGPRLNSR